jgi:hypothetical protein
MNFIASRKALRRSFAAGALTALSLGCSPTAPPSSRIAVAPSLRPVDAARPIVVFGQIRGEACGNDAVAGAVRNLKRLDGVDGYVEVVIEETGDGPERCARVTAYPFRYGTSTDTPALRAGDESPVPVAIPGRPVETPPPAPNTSAAPSASAQPPVDRRSPENTVDCSSACAAFAKLVETGSIKQGLAKDRCNQRCAQPDPAFAACISAAHTPEAAKKCL